MPNVFEFPLCQSRAVGRSCFAIVLKNQLLLFSPSSLVIAWRVGFGVMRPYTLAGPEHHCDVLSPLRGVAPLSVSCSLSHCPSAHGWGSKQHVPAGQHLSSPLPLPQRGQFLGLVKEHQTLGNTSWLSCFGHSEPAEHLAVQSTELRAVLLAEGDVLSRAARADGSDPRAWRSLARAMPSPCAPSQSRSVTVPR